VLCFQSMNLLWFLWQQAFIYDWPVRAFRSFLLSVYPKAFDCRMVSSISSFSFHLSSIFFHKSTRKMNQSVGSWKRSRNFLEIRIHLLVESYAILSHRLVSLLFPTLIWSEPIEVQRSEMKASPHRSRFSHRMEDISWQQIASSNIFSIAYRSKADVLLKILS